jgi:hypothetical protein
VSGGKQARNTLVYYLSLMRNTCWTDHVVIQVDRQLVVFDDQSKKRRDVA